MLQYSDQNQLEFSVGVNFHVCKGRTSHYINDETQSYQNVTFPYLKSGLHGIKCLQKLKKAQFLLVTCKFGSFKTTRYISVQLQLQQLSLVSFKSAKKSVSPSIVRTPLYCRHLDIFSPVSILRRKLKLLNLLMDSILIIIIFHYLGGLGVSLA